MNWYNLYKEVKHPISNWIDNHEANCSDKIEKYASDAVDTVPPQTEEKRKFKYPNEIDVDKAYQQFSESYQKSTGKAWEKYKFLNRIPNWIFYGDTDKGYISVRPQKSGLYKLVGIAGDDSNPISKLKSILK